jgi:hypothetical protein
MDSHWQGPPKHGAASAVDAFGDERTLSHSPGFQSTVADGEQIVIVDAQLANPLDMFPSESTESEAAQPAAALDILEQDQFRPSTQLPLRPTRYHARQSTNHRLVVVCMIAVSVLVLLGRSALLRRSEVPARSSDVSVSATATSRTLENPSTPQLPSSPAKQSRVVGNLSDRTSIGRGRSAPSPSPTDTTASRKSANVRQGRQPLREARNTVPAPVTRRSVPVEHSTDAATAPRRSFEPAPLGEPPGSDRRELANEPAVRSEEPRAVVPTPPSAPVASPPSSTAASPLEPQTRAIATVLNRYEQAFSALDANAAQAVWPSVDVKALGRAFDQLDEQTFALEGCNINVAGARAEAECGGNTRYIRKVGNRALRVEPRHWHFRLRQRDDQWVIDAVDAR